MGEIYAGLARLRDRYADLVRERFPRIPRRVSGYNLDELLPENGFHVARALVGSEGTCANIVSATLNLTASPPFRVLTVLGFDDPFLAADAVPLALEHKPIGLEGFDYMLVDFMRRKGLALRRPSTCFRPASAFCWSRWAHGPRKRRRPRPKHWRAQSQSWPAPPVAHICTPDEAASVWHVRESALGAMVFVPGEPDRWEGWEDAAVPPEQLGEYLRAITKLMTEYGYRSPLYGHYGQGCVHMRINFDFRTAEGMRQFREFIDRAADVVLCFGGSLSGEHGDGQSRAALLPKMFGPELIEAFREFKSLWDPDNRMNPGKLVGCGARLRSRWRTCATARGRPAEAVAERTALETHFVFAADEGSLERATERCVGVGSCRNTQGGVMCPSYRATGEEQHSTRGRAHLLWEMLAGALARRGLQEPRRLRGARPLPELQGLQIGVPGAGGHDGLQVGVPGAALQGPPAPAASLHLRLCRPPGPLRLADSGADQRHPHRPADQSARQAHRRRGAASGNCRAWRRRAIAKRVPRPLAQPAREAPTQSQTKRLSHRRRSLLWPDTWNNYYHPQTLAAAESVLTEAGFRVETPQRTHLLRPPALRLRPARRGPRLSGARARPHGSADRRRPALHLSRAKLRQRLQGRTAGAFPERSPRADAQRQVWLLADWLAAKAPDFAAGRLEGAQILLHGHCHHKAVFGGPANEIALLRQAGATVEPIQAGCCGMAGPFGFEADKFEVSKAIANDGLLPAVECCRPDDDHRRRRLQLPRADRPAWPPHGAALRRGAGARQGQIATGDSRKGRRPVLDSEECRSRLRLRSLHAVRYPPVSPSREQRAQNHHRRR